MNDWFQFKRFIVKQDRCAMKVGTDGVLLGAWAQGSRRILDIGTGTGLIALMMAQRFPDAVVDAVEIDGVEIMAIIFAKRLNLTVGSFVMVYNVFHTRVNVFETSLQDYAKDFEGQPYDAIVSNPPYFNNSLKNPDGRRTIARHTDSLPYAVLFRSVDKLLAANGAFSLIVPNDIKADILTEAAVFGFFLLRETAVKTTSSKQPKRCLFAFTKVRPESVNKETVTMMNADATPSSWYSNLTEDFYLSKE